MIKIIIIIIANLVNWREQIRIKTTAVCIFIVSGCFKI